MAKSTVIGTNEQRIGIKELRHDKVLSYDIDNIYPQRVKNTIASSGTATACTRLLKTHLFGRGFADEIVGDTVVNSKGQTMTKLHELICLDYARYRGAALHIGYNGLLEIISIAHIPFEYVRINLPDDLGNTDQGIVYEDWDLQRHGRKKTNLIKSIDFFTTNQEKIQSQIEGAGGFDKWNGHIVYFSSDGFLAYPTATCDPVLEDVETDAGIKTFKQRNIRTGFMVGSIFVHKGKFEDDDDRQEFIGNLENFQGASNSNRILMVEAETEEQIPEIKPFTVVNNDKLFELTETSVRENIIRNYGQPLVLHAIKTPGSLGDSTEWEDAKKNYDERTEAERDALVEIYRELLINFEGLSFNEEINLLIIPISGVKGKAKKAVLATTIGVGGMVSLQSIISDPLLNSDQKINYCVLVFGMTKLDADSLVNGTPIKDE